jgi:O-antigen biosynthesis protein
LQLTVIIVNYNVQFFLEQCLYAVQNAIANIQAEVIVVDNNSSDGSIAYLQPKFDWVQFICNKENVGFSKANNQAVAIAKGDYILFLNPDTLVPENCFEQCIAFMKTHKDAGALGIKMIDGSGQFLPESKRGFPSPLTSFFKLTGMASLFSKSKLFAQYHLGHLSNAHTAEVDVLAGAYMLIPKPVLDLSGSFDNQFFMYGEDVDLSYRIQNTPCEATRGNYKNYYFAESTIVHFKGESTKRGSLNYVKMFYNAMSVFVKKHYGGSKALLFNFFIQIAIFFRAGISLVGSFLKFIGLPLLDAIIIMASFLMVKYLWITFVKPGLVPLPIVTQLLLPAFTLVFIIAGGIAGLYEKWYQHKRAWYAMLVAIVLNLALYALLHEDYRFSRGIVLFGGLLAALLIILFRWLLLKTKIISTSSAANESKQTLIIATPQHYNEVVSLMQAAGLSTRILGRVAPTAVGNNYEDALGNITNLTELVKRQPVKEIIFCINQSLSLQTAIAIMDTKLGLRYKFHYPNTQSIVGSDSKDASGETLEKMQRFNLSKPQNLRYKRVVDITCSLLLLVTLPIHLLFIPNKLHLLHNIFNVLAGNKTWVGYKHPSKLLPPIKNSVLYLNNDEHYATNYEWINDVQVICKKYMLLGN